MFIKSVKILLAILFLFGALAGGQTWAQSIKIMTYNIHHGNPPNTSIINLDTIAGVIKKENPDLVALQEVDVNTTRANGINQAEYLAKKLGMLFFFAKAIDFAGGEYGVCILSKYPIVATKHIKLPHIASPEAETRVLALAKVRLPDERHIWLACTHLDATANSETRLLQIDSILSATRNPDAPLIIAGDFNANENSGEIAMLDKQFKRSCKNCAFTIPTIGPTQAIDFIAFRRKYRFKVESHRVINEAYASDHLPVTVVLKLR